METYEVERIADSAADTVRRELQGEIDQVKREMEHDISTLRSRLDEALEIHNDLARMVGDLARVVGGHQEAWRVMQRIGEGL